MNKEKSLTSSILNFLIAPFVFLYTIFSYGFSGSVIYGWFLQTKFNLPPLSIAEMMGVVIFFEFLTNKTPSLFDFKSNDLLTAYDRNRYRFVKIIYVAIFPWSMLISGFLVKYIFL